MRGEGVVRKVDAIVVMGPAGAGKTTVGQALASALGWHFYDADDFHPPANVERMRRGVALTDVERHPWLTELRSLLARAIEDCNPVVLACSALRASYRAALMPVNATPGAVRFVYLRATPSLLQDRLTERSGHFAPAALLDSQLATLEEPASDEALIVDASQSPDAIVLGVRRTWDI